MLIFFFKTLFIIFRLTLVFSCSTRGVSKLSSVSWPLSFVSWPLSKLCKMLYKINITVNRLSLRKVHMVKLTCICGNSFSGVVICSTTTVRVWRISFSDSNSLILFLSLKESQILNFYITRNVINLSRTIIFFCVLLLFSFFIEVFNSWSNQCLFAQNLIFWFEVGQVCI